MPTFLHRRLASGAILVLLTGACSFSEPIDAEDHGTLFVTARVQAAIEDEDEQTEGPEQRTRGVVLEVSENVFAGGTESHQPADADLDYRIRETGVAARFQGGNESFAYALLAGIQMQNVELEFWTPVGSGDSEREFMIGPMFGTEGSWHPVEWLRLHARVTISGPLPVAYAFSLEGGVGLRVVEECEVFVGYRHWRLHANYLELFEESGEVDLEVDGLVLGTELSF